MTGLSFGDYAAYLAAVTREIDDAEAAGRPTGVKPARGDSARHAPRPRSARSDRDVRKEIATIEKAIARLDAEKRQHDAALLVATDPAEALRLHDLVTEAARKLAEQEERWLALQEEIGG